MIFALKSIVTQRRRFVVNDSAWFSRRPNGKVTPIVMNMAKFISARILDTLEQKRRWKQRITILDQEIDGWIELESPGKKLRIPADRNFVEFFHRHFAKSGETSPRKEFLRCWHNYVRVGIRDLKEVAAEFQRFFRPLEADEEKIKIGLEFETGNIASSFRALNKLETLFVTEKIDYGVFITSIDKEHAAARIWPQSNRNGSFQELERRNYKNNLTVPLWEFGFEPDAFDQTSPYFNTESTYFPIATGRRCEYEGVQYEVFLRGQEEVLKPVTPRRNLDSDAT